MGCKQTKTNPSSVVNTTTTSTAPIHVKSVLKNSRANEAGKSERLSGSKRDTPGVNKSVNFDEKVEVKVRTPTPKIRYDEPTFGRRQSFNDDDDDGGTSVVSSFSSQEDAYREQFTIQSTSSTSSLQRKPSNNLWHKSNTVAVLPSMTNSNENNLTSSSVYPIENTNIPKGKTFRVHRKIEQSVRPQSPNAVVSTQSSSVSSHPPKVQSASFTMKRPLPNTNTVLVEHRASFTNTGPSAQPAYYAFSRRSNENTTSTTKTK